MKSALTGLRAVYRKLRSPDKRTRLGRTRGFTLLETLAAITILAIALTSLFQSHASGIKGVGVNDDYMQAQILAQSLLTETTAMWRQPLKSRQGRWRKFRWQVIISPAPGHLPAGTGEGRWQLAHVVAVVSWHPGRSIRLETLKLSRAPS